MYSSKTKQIYIRKIFPHDLTHEVSVTTEIVSEFFENGGRFTFYKGDNHDIQYSVTINNATDPRFGGDFASLWSADGLDVNDLIIVKKISSREFELTTAKRGTALYEYMEKTLTGNQRHAVLFTEESERSPHPALNKEFLDSSISHYLTAIRTKPFILLAGISGTGKSRIVRKLAQATDDIDIFENDEDRWKCPRPANFELIQVKPNWHNSMDVVGFKSNINGEHYEFTPFVDFVVKAWCHEDTPFFLCLDEMNLAPVEEYFAEFLSAIESRSFGVDGEFETDPIIKAFDSFGSELAGKMMHHFVEMGYDLPKNVETRLREKGLTLRSHARCLIEQCR